MKKFLIFSTFLNGVCRHEHRERGNGVVAHFLNGVCRHELWRNVIFRRISFLNGVCRHEHSSFFRYYVATAQ
ncbi:hypothetical protein URS_2245 [Acinetobacter ursingii]|nr:hypothetical protein URS_2245 [Acinetobacter ursingii]